MASTPQKTCEICQAEITKGRKSSIQFNKARFCSNKCRGVWISINKRGTNNSNYKGGKSRCIECNEELAERYSYRITLYCKKCWYHRINGEHHPNWQGGITPINYRIRGTKKYREWRNAVFKRDNYICQDCGYSKGRILEAHHIKPFSLFPEQRFDVENGTTLCIPCHKKTDTWGGKLKKIKNVNTI
jgi:5-methylcytosine-specific restriction endonuclease McrA